MEKQTARCGARLRNKPGQTCRRWPLANGTGRCALHGGRALSGPDSPTWKHGRFSKWLPKHLLAEAERAIQDPEFRQIRVELALLDQCMGRVVRRAFYARKEADRSKAQRLFAELVLARSRLLTEESRREMASSNMMSRARVGVIMTAFAMAVRDVVQTSSYITNRNGFLGEVQQHWRKVSKPLLRTPSPTETAPTQPASPGGGASDVPGAGGADGYQHGPPD